MVRFGKCLKMDNYNFLDIFRHFSEKEIKRIPRMEISR